METRKARAAAIDTCCQRCKSLVASCSCGEEQQLPDYAADDFVLIAKGLAEIETVKADMRARPAPLETVEYGDFLYSG